MNITIEALERVARLLDAQLLVDWRSQYVTQMEGESLRDAITRTREHIVIYKAIKATLFEVAMADPPVTQEGLPELEADIQHLRDILHAIVESYPAIKILDTQEREQGRFDADTSLAAAKQMKAAT